MTKKTKSFPLPLSKVIGTGASEKTAYPDGLGRRGGSRLPVAGTPIRRPESTALEKRVSASREAAYSFATKTLRSLVERLSRAGISDEAVLSAIGQVPRHLFVEPGLSGQAYEDNALPIGSQQTISKPSTVAKMLEALRKGRQGEKLSKILEIGTGSGYQAAILAKIADEVYSIERIKSLHELARRNLRLLRISNLRLHYGDGMQGLPQVAPFDGIVIAAAGIEVPEALLEQLAIGGRLVAPVGQERQRLQLVERVSENEWQSMVLDECNFVPLRQGTV